MSTNAPASPDYQGIAQKQTQANRPDINTPYAQQGWEQGPDGQWRMKTGFSGPMADVNTNLQGQLRGLETPMDWGQFGQVGNGEAARDQAINAAYGQATSRLNPQWDQRENQMRAQLANQGLDPNSEAARGAQSQFGQARNDAYGSAMNSAIAQGQAAGDSVFRNNMMARQQALSEALRKRGMPMEELKAMQGFLAMPGFSQTGDMLQGAQMQGEADWRRFMAQRQMEADMISGGMQLAGSLPGLFMLSDEGAKQDVVRLPVDALPGVPFATWRYRPEVDPWGDGRTHVGVIAQDLERVAPEYVTTRADGLKVVDYRFLLEV